MFFGLGCDHTFGPVEHVARPGDPTVGVSGWVFGICKTPTFSSDDPKSSYRSVDVFFLKRSFDIFWSDLGGGGSIFFGDIAENEKV